MRCTKDCKRDVRRASILVLVVFSLVILIILGTALLAVAYGVRHRSIMIKSETVATFAAEAGYERAVFWMSQQPDMLSALKMSTPGITGSINLPNAVCEYSIQFLHFVGGRPIYRVISNGHSGLFHRTVDVDVFQEIGGWESTHRVPSNPSATVAWPFCSGEVIDMPLHVNKYDDTPDVRDIYISGSPDFRQRVSIGESRYAGGTDKYGNVMRLFDSGIYFDQPDNKISQKDTVQQKVESFKQSTKSQFIFTPQNMVPGGQIQNPSAAVQLEFSNGKVRITNNCTVRGYQGSGGTHVTYDYKISDSSTASPYTKYDIYAYHLKPITETSVLIPIEDTYVRQSYGGEQSELGGQIFVEGNVIIGGPAASQAIAGQLTIVATGNIWVADAIVVDGHRDGSMPAMDNPNAIGLIAQGVIKIVDPGMSDYSYVDDKPFEPEDFEYVPIGRPDNSSAAKGHQDYHKRHLPNPMVVEAAITVGGGGWGAENVGNRKDTAWFSDKLIVRGCITEAMRGIVGTFPPLWNPNPGNGYSKHYYFDERLLRGILPGYIWLKGKFIPAPDGWHDYRPESDI